MIQYYQQPSYGQQPVSPPPVTQQPYPGYNYQQQPGIPMQEQVGYPQQQPVAPPLSAQPVPNGQPQLPFFEQSYIENILRLNLGKVATIYMSFENTQWGSKIFKGVLEAAGKDHIIISDPVTNMRYLLLTIYLNYITFDEEINYEYPFGGRNKQSDKNK